MLTPVESSCKAKVNEAKCVPGAGRVGLQHDVGWGDVHVADHAIQVQMEQSLQRTCGHMIDRNMVDERHNAFKSGKGYVRYEVPLHQAVVLQRRAFAAPS